MAVIKKFRNKSFEKSRSIISLKNISLSFGRRKILDNVSFKINHGQILGMLGPNGVGKSTIFNLITGLIKPDYGKIKFDFAIVWFNQSCNQLKIVDFPTPLGPNIPKISLWLILKLTLSKIFLLPNDKDIFSKEIIG